MYFNQIYIFYLVTHFGMSHKQSSINLFSHEQYSIENDKELKDAGAKISNCMVSLSCEICGQQFAKTDLKKQHLIWHFKERLLADIKATSSDSVENYQIYKCPHIECQFMSSNKWKT